MLLRDANVQFRVRVRAVGGTGDPIRTLDHWRQRLRVIWYPYGRDDVLNPC
jgi:hypothetical protein